MKIGRPPTLKNRFLLWWHCLIHSHQRSEGGTYRLGRPTVTEIWCYNCGYLKDVEIGPIPYAMHKLDEL